MGFMRNSPPQPHACEILYINSFVCLSRSSSPSQKADWAQPSTPGLSNFHRLGLPWGVSGRVRHRRPTGSLVPCTGGTGTIVLWFPTRAVRARLFSSSQHGWCGHGRSLIPSTGGVWPGGGALRCCRREKRRRRTEERREEEKRREEKRDLDWS